MVAKLETVAPRLRIDITYLVKMIGGLAVYSGFSRGIVDRTVVRGLDGLPYLPASTLKGRARDMAEKLAKVWGIHVCESPDPKTMCPAKHVAADEYCLVCRTFGMPGRSSVSGNTGLIWRDAHLVDEDILQNDNKQSPQKFFYQRTQVQISRPRGVALAKHLFTSENTIEDLVFKGRIRGWLEKTYIEGSTIPDALVLLCAALKLINFVGGGKSRGLGQCEVEFIGKIEVGDQKFEPKEVLQYVNNLGNRT